MSQERFKLIREKLFNYINDELLKKYDVLEYCNMYESSDSMNWDVEFIFKLKYSLTIEEKNFLEIDLKKDIRKFLNDVCDMPYYYLAILFILDDT